MQQLKILRGAIMLRRSLHTSRPGLISEKAFENFKLKQARMQCDDEYPVYLKCGLRDKILLLPTLGMTLFCTIKSLRLGMKFSTD